MEVMNQVVMGNGNRSFLREPGYFYEESISAGLESNKK
jgi:hypothetical protein